jgi:hypothetical protein
MTTMEKARWHDEALGPARELVLRQGSLRYFENSTDGGDGRPERVGRLVLTSCDYRDDFPPPMFRCFKLAVAIPGAMKLLTERVIKAIDPRYTNEAADRLHEYDKPALIAWSRDDRLFKPAHARRLADDLPNARLEWIENAPHVLARGPARAPRRVNRRVRARPADTPAPGGVVCATRARLRREGRTVQERISSGKVLAVRGALEPEDGGEGARAPDRAEGDAEHWRCRRRADPSPSLDLSAVVRA